MSDVKWIKIKTDIFDDEKVKIIDTLPDNDAILVIWFKLLTLAGKVNEEGYLFLNSKTPYTLDMLSAIFNRKKSTISLALKTFEQFDMVEIEDNDLINISNWGKHQNIEGLDKIKKQRRERTRKFRKKKKQKLLNENSNVTGDVTETLSNGTELELEVEVEEERDSKDNKFDYKSIYEYYISQENLVSHTNYTDSMYKSMKSAKEKYDLTEEQMKRIIKDHNDIIKLAENTEYPVKRRRLDILFGQKVNNNATSPLIFAEYLDGGKKSDYLYKLRNEKSSKVNYKDVYDDIPEGF
jgi:predicted phage replisome organizer